MIFLINRRGKILSVTKEGDKSAQNFAALAGYNFSSFAAHADAARINQFLNDISERSEVVTCEIGLSLEDNSAPVYHCIGVPTGEDQICIFARRVDTPNAAAPNANMSAQLADAKQRIRVLFDKLPVALLVVNTKCVIEAVNPIAEKMFGHSGDAWLQLSLNKLLHGCADVSSEFLFNRLAETPGKLTRFDGFRSDGERFPIEMSAEFIDSTNKRLLVSMFDITERIKLEQLKREFLEMVSHDLRTPLSNLVLFLEAITMGVHSRWSDEKLRGNAEKNFEEVSRLIRLINKLLDIDKLEEGFDKPEIARIFLPDPIESAINAVTATATKKGVKFASEPLEEMILADPDQLAQILINLLGNAVKFSPENGTITVKTIAVPGAMEIRICDEGPGIPEHLREHIFERFGQVKSAKSKEGTGLGLAICKSLVEAHGGTIGVTSEEGNGSEFWFRIPFQKEESNLDDD